MTDTDMGPCLVNGIIYILIGKPKKNAMWLAFFLVKKRREKSKRDKSAKDNLYKIKKKSIYDHKKQCTGFELSNINISIRSK